jgi:hypothetical protein
MLFASHAPQLLAGDASGPEPRPAAKESSPREVGHLPSSWHLRLSRARSPEVGAVARSNVPGGYRVARGWMSRAPCSERARVRTASMGRETSGPRRRRCPVSRKVHARCSVLVWCAATACDTLIVTSIACRTRCVLGSVAVTETRRNGLRRYGSLRVRCCEAQIRP